MSLVPSTESDDPFVRDVITLYDIIHLLAPYPPGHVHALPDLPWYLLPSTLSPVPATWDRTPSEATARFTALHNKALDAARAVWAATPRDDAAAKTAQNRKKRERKLRSIARKKDEVRQMGKDDDADEDEEVNAGRVVRDQYDGIWNRITDDDKLREATLVAEDLSAILAARLSFVHEGSPWVWGFPPTLSAKLASEYLKVYMDSHTSFAQIRGSAPGQPISPLKEHTCGDAFFFPNERPAAQVLGPPRTGIFRHPKTGKMLLLMETVEVGRAEASTAARSRPSPLLPSP